MTTMKTEGEDALITQFKRVFGDAGIVLHEVGVIEASGDTPKHLRVLYECGGQDSYLNLALGCNESADQLAAQALKMVDLMRSRK